MYDKISAVRRQASGMNRHAHIAVIVGVTVHEDVGIVVRLLFSGKDVAYLPKNQLI